MLGESATAEETCAEPDRPGSARLFVTLVLAAVGAELLQLEPVGVVAAILLGDVVAVLAHLACQGDLGPYVST